MANGRPGFSLATPADKVYTGSCGIEEQVGFYGDAAVPDMDRHTGQAPAAGDDRFTNVIGTLPNAK